MSNKRKAYAEQIANEFIKRIKAGTAPWQKPWNGHSTTPVNATTGNAYRGINRVWLGLQSTTDPRWATYKQAQAKGWQVRKGERGTQIEYWQFTRQKKNEAGETITVQLERPYRFVATVFHASQIDGMPELPKVKLNDITPNNTGVQHAMSHATVEHRKGDTAHYNITRDKIVLPLPGQFHSETEYNQTALHELAHWTGHETRLERDFSDYAREELRAEIASYMLGEHYQIGHKVDNSAAYVASWIQELQSNPMEIISASRDAQAIVDYITAL